MTFIAFSASMLNAQILATTARQGSSGSLKLLTYYQAVQGQKLNFSVNGSGTCTTTNGINFGCASTSDVEGKGNGGAGMVKLVWQPWQRFQYYAMFGVGDYSLSVPSTTTHSLLTGDVHGQIYGAGIKASIVPDTIVTPAIALDLSMMRSVYQYNRRFPGVTPAADDSIKERLELMTYQVAVETSHLFVLKDNWKLEPYGGVKWVRVQTDLKDLDDGSHAGGHKDTVTPFLGLKIPIEEHESVFAEASYIDGYHFGAGLELRFK